MSWAFFAIGSVLFFTSLNLLQRVLAVDGTYPRAIAIIFTSFGALISIGYFFLSGSYNSIKIPTQIDAWVLLFVATVCYGVYERGRFIVAKLLDASVMTTVQNVSVLVAFAGSLFLYSESLTPFKAVGAGLILISLVLVSFTKTKTNSSIKGILLCVGISILIGIAWMLDKRGVEYFSTEGYNVLVWTIPALLLFLPSVKLHELTFEYRRAYKQILILAALNVVGYLLQLKALALTEATRVIPLLQTSTLFTVLLGIILLRERNNIKRKMIAGVLAIIGASLLM